MAQWGQGLNIADFTNDAAEQTALNIVYQRLVLNVTSPAANATLAGDTVITGTATSGNIASIALTEDQGTGNFISVPLDSAGNFSFPFANQSSGSHTVNLVATDLSGRSTSTSLTVTVNTTGPTITSFDLGTSSDTGTVGDHITNLATVTLVGVTEAGASVALAGTSQTVTADSSGNFTFSGVTLSAGANTFNITATDSANRTATDSVTVTLDATPPTLGVALSDDNGSSTTDGITSDPAVAGTVSATGASLASVVVGLDGAGTFPLDVTSRVSSGSFAITAADVNTLAGGTLSAGAHTLHFKATDAAGNVTTQDVTFTFATPPTTPNFDLDSATDTGTTGDHTTLLANVTLVGTTTANATVTITDSSNNALASGNADGSGHFTFAAIPVATGSNVLTATATISGGFTATFSQTILRDSTPPTLTASLGNDTGSSSTDKITSDPTITGTAVDGTNAVVALVGSADGDTSLSTNLISNLGAGNTFTLSPTVVASLLGGTISQGTHTLHLRDTDIAGNTTDFDFTFTFDTTTVTPTLDLDPASDTGTLGDHETNLAAVALDGVAEASATLVLKDGSGNTVGTVTADGTTGAFSFTSVPLAAGANTFTVTATDPAGNTASFMRTITRDSTGPTINAGLANDTGTSSTDGITNDPTVSGTALDGVLAPASLKASLDGDSSFDTDITSSLQANGTFTLSAALMNTIAGGTLSQGAHTLHLKAIDAGGNSITTDVTFTFDNVLATPTLDLAANSDTGTVGDQHTSLASVTLAGTTSPSVSVTLKDGSGNVLSTTTSDSSGNFAFSATLVLGANQFTVVAADTAGNTASFAQTITRDDAGPVLTAALSDDTGTSNTDGITSDPTITGSATPNATTNKAVTALALAVDGGSFIDATVLLGSDGSFTVSASTLATVAGVATLADGAHTLHIASVDSNNDVTKLDVAFTLDTTIGTPTVSLDAASDTGTLGDNRTSLGTITLDGTADPGVGVALLDGANQLLASTTADATTGKYTFTGTLALGDNTFTVVAIDAAGNQGSASIVITQADGPTLAASLSNDTGTSPNDGITSDITVMGTVSTPVSTSVVSLTGTLDGGTPIDLTSLLSSGAFTITPADLGTVAQGTHALVVTATNNLGDATSVTVNFNFDNTTATPTFDLNSSFDDGTFGDHQTSIPTVTLDGTAEAGAKISVTDGSGNPVGTNTTASGTGTFSYSNVALALGDNTFNVTATDVAGNTATFTQVITLYAVTPTVTAALSHDTGTSSTDGVTTNDDITGTLAEPNGFISKFTVQIDGGSVFDASPIVVGDGSFDLAASDIDQIAGGTLAAGPHTIVFSATGSAGTIVTTTVDFTLDVVANPTLTLDPTTAFGAAINNTTDLAAVNLLGITLPNTLVTLTDSQNNVLGTMTSDSSGNYSFTGVAVAPGDNNLTVSIPADVAGNIGTTTIDVHRNSAPTVMAAITPQTLSSTDTSIDLAGVFTDADLADSLVQFNTNQGNFDVDLLDKVAPQTVANFLDYVNDGFYNGTFFHRLAHDATGQPFVLQAGGFTLVNGTFGTVPQLAPVANEFDFSNTAGTLAMAKVSGDPNSATNQFFFNLEDNSSALDNQNGGFTVFGVLASPAAAQAVINLAQTPTFDASFGNPMSPFTDLPLVNYAGNGSQFPDDAIASNSFIVVNSISILKQPEKLTYSIVSNTNPTLATVSLDPNANERLTVHLNSGQTGTGTITIKATDLAGDSVTTTFTVSA